MKVALPDLVSNSYFPAIAAVELGFFRDEGIDATIELIFPVTETVAALRDGRVDFVAGSAHAPLATFPGFAGARLLCALSQGMYWFLVARSSLGIARGDIAALAGRRITAAPGVDIGLRRLIAAAGIDAEAAGMVIGPLPGGVPNGASFGVAAAAALGRGDIDAFWANGMGAEVAVESGAGAIVVDVRRGDGPATAFGFTHPALATTERLIAERPEAAAGAVRAIARAHRALKDDPGLATAVGTRLFPATEAGLIRRLIERDLPWYDTGIAPEAVAGMTAFARDVGLLDGDLDYPQVVADQFSDLWRS